MWTTTRHAIDEAFYYVGRRPPLLLLIMAISLIPLLGPVASWATPEKHLTGKDRVDAVNSTRQILLAAVGGMVVLTGAAFTGRTFYMSRRGQYTDRYTKAITQLASDKLTERLGGIYALEHVMIESERDHQTVVDVLAAFIRERAPVTRVTSPVGPIGAENWPGQDHAAHDIRPPTDVQAALTVIGRRPRRNERGPILLEWTDLRGALLVGARLDHVDLSGAHLQGASLADATLRHASLEGAQLQGVSLGGADLYCAFMINAQLQRAHLTGANLRYASLFGANLDSAILDPPQLDEAIVDYPTAEVSRSFGAGWLKDKPDDVESNANQA